MVRAVMDRAVTTGGDAAGRRTDRPGPADAATWEAYYREASRRRHARGGLRENFSREKRRRRRREYLFLVTSSVFTGGLLLLFYGLLSR